ncbi:hypothetical protein ABID95_004191 [Streptomyces atratus]
MSLHPWQAKCAHVLLGSAVRTRSRVASGPTRDSRVPEKRSARTLTQSADVAAVRHRRSPTRIDFRWGFCGLGAASRQATLVSILIRFATESVSVDFYTANWSKSSLATAASTSSVPYPVRRNNSRGPKAETTSCASANQCPPIRDGRVAMTSELGASASFASPEENPTPTGISASLSRNQMQTREAPATRASISRSMPMSVCRSAAVHPNSMRRDSWKLGS